MRRSTKEGWQFAGLASVAVIVWAIVAVLSVAIPVAVIVLVLRLMDVI